MNSATNSATMHSEQQFARQICRVLDLGTRSIEPVVAERLRAARERALQRQLVPARGLSIVGAGGGAGAAVLQSGWLGSGGRALRTLLPILALLLGVSLAYYWNGFAQASVNEEIDSALLAGDLPPSAYLDRGFQAWLEKYSPAGE
ncbi:MAG: DUF3619 family protein [Rhodocyclaceae bacterium]|nr:DUF3619 family protein [Rhodocyclaceae bacterium]MDP1957443.1 DUF3619 family protein [Rhodocyclaceae bacterium]